MFISLALEGEVLITKMCHSNYEKKKNLASLLTVFESSFFDVRRLDD